MQGLKKKRSSSRRGSWQCGVGALAQVCATVFEVLFLFNLLTRSYRMNSNLDDASSTSSILINISSSHVFGFWIARGRDFRRGDDGMVVAAQVGDCSLVLILRRLQVLPGSFSPIPDLHLSRSLLLFSFITLRIHVPT